MRIGDVKIKNDGPLYDGPTIGAFDVGDKVKFKTQYLKYEVINARESVVVVNEKRVKKAFYLLKSVYMKELYAKGKDKRDNWVCEDELELDEKGGVKK